MKLLGIKRTQLRSEKVKLGKGIEERETKGCGQED